MIVTESKNRKIKICDQILEEIYSQIQKNDYDPEKGGIIVGRENLNNENIILEYISKPLKNDICTRTRYTRKDEGHLKYFEKLYNENNGVYAYWGEWHTHPEDIPHYSIIDLKNWKRIGKEDPKGVQYHIIAGRKAFSIWRMQKGKLYLHLDTEQLPVLCAASREIPGLLRKMLWNREEGMSAILTSGTLKAGTGFLRTRQITGLEGRAGVQEYVAESPFSYEKNCLLYLPKTLEHCRRGSREEALMVANHIHSLICSTYGHTLVLFTSYTLMGSVYQILRDSLPFPMVEVWRHSQEEILRFKTMENGVLFAAGSCWEGVDFPGDMVSSLIIVKLPFAVPDPISEAEKETYDSLESYIQSIIVPDMQKKLRQGFGRAIRTETDTCVVSILDIRAGKGGKYHEDVMCALPSCRIAEELKEVQDFIRSRKGVEYYL